MIPTPHLTEAEWRMLVQNMKDPEAFMLSFQQSAHTMTILEWHERFELLTAAIESQTRNIHYVQLALSAINHIKPSLSPEMNNLYELHAHLFILEKLVNPSSLSAGAFIGYHTHAAISDVQEAIMIHFEKGAQAAAIPAFWNRIIETLSYLRELIQISTADHPYFAKPYLWLWRLWIHPNVKDISLYKEELRLLQEMEGADAPSRYTLLIAKSKMFFYLGHDEQAQGGLKQLSSRKDFNSESILYVLNDLSIEGEWQRLLGWLVEMAPLLERHHSNYTESYFRYWDTLIEHLPHAEDQMWEQIYAMLPYARSIYEEKLLKHGKWKQWIDYQLSTGGEPLQYRATVYAPMEKEAPEVLLPFYHQSVEKNVLLKNRDGYKAAVKLLKRLAKLYKKMKNEAQWEDFITAFASRHSRLRALQEELRKGKLIP